MTLANNANSYRWKQLLAGCVVALGLLAWVAAPRAFAAPESSVRGDYDVVVYGGTSCGVMAAVQVARLGKSVVIIEPGRRLGGMSSHGLGATDIGNKAAIGGLAREFYQRVHDHYAKPEAWVHETPAEYRQLQGRRADVGAMWTFEPHVAERIFNDFVKEHGIEVLYGERLDRDAPVRKEGLRLTELPLESGRSVRGRVFIDAAYEGDLMAWAGVAYVVGREASDVFDESLAGVQMRMAMQDRYTQRTHPFYHQFAMPLDPFVVPVQPESGLLWGIAAWQPPPDGTGDDGVQAYCFRMCQTDVPENRLPWVKPADYDESRYELLLRYFEAGEHRTPLHMVRMPNRKTDTNNNGAFSTDHIGANHDWPEAGYAERERLLAEHRSYQQGLLWTLAHHPRVPVDIRQEVATWGLCRDEFTDNDGWPQQLYVREARRMRSDYVMTQHDCQGRRRAEDGIGLAAYQMDSHHVRRFFDGERVLNEGLFEVGGLTPYPISYRAIVPRRGECINLLVPICLSASHVAYGSIRMEPVFMVLGQAAATAAVLAIDADRAVQDVEYAALRERLLVDGQRLEWSEPAD